MKIGLICPYNLFKGGGVQECVFAMQAELAARGHEVLIVSPQPRTVPEDIPPFVRLLGRAADMKSPFHTTAQVSVSVDMRAVDDLLAHEDFDVLHFHEPWVPFLARQIIRRVDTKNVATFHAKLPESVVSKTIERAITPYTKSILKYLDGLTAVSPAAAEYIQELTKDTVEIIPNGIHVDKFRVRGREDTHDTLLYIGRLEKRKGLKYLLKAFAVLQKKRPEVKLLIAGDGPDREKLEEFSHELELHDVSFLGHVSEEEKMKLLSEADLFVSPALYGESFGIVLLEAMAADVPIVAGDNPGYRGVLQGRGQLSLINPRSTADFAGRLEVMLTDEDVRSAWRKWAATYVQQFDYSHVVDEYEKLYKRVCHA